MMRTAVLRAILLITQNMKSDLNAVSVTSCMPRRLYRRCIAGSWHVQSRDQQDERRDPSWMSEGKLHRRRRTGGAADNRDAFDTEGVQETGMRVGLRFR